MFLVHHLRHSRRPKAACQTPELPDASADSVPVGCACFLAHSSPGANPKAVARPANFLATARRQFVSWTRIRLWAALRTRQTGPSLDLGRTCVRAWIANHFFLYLLMASRQYRRGGAPCRLGLDRTVAKGELPIPDIGATDRSGKEGQQRSPTNSQCDRRNASVRRPGICHATGRFGVRGKPSVVLC